MQRSIANSFNISKKLCIGSQMGHIKNAIKFALKDALKSKAKFRLIRKYLITLHLLSDCNIFGN